MAAVHDPLAVIHTLDVACNAHDLGTVLSLGAVINGEGRPPRPTDLPLIAH